jgi:hypothetical protein
MQEQHDSVEVTEGETEFEKLYAEAVELDVYIPNWVNKRFSNLYKFAYLQLKKDSDSVGMSAANRTKIIKGLMEMYYKKILENAQVSKEESKQVEGGNDEQGQSVL